MISMNGQDSTLVSPAAIYFEPAYHPRASNLRDPRPALRVETSSRSGLLFSG